jgi:putative flippase GtrA
VRVTDSPAPISPPRLTSPAKTKARLVALTKDRRVRYVVTGGIAAVVAYLVFAALWLLTAGRVPYLALVLVANLVTALIMYPMYAKVFESTRLSVRGFLRFYVVCLWSLVWSFIGMPLLVEIVHLPVLVALPIVIATGPLINYQVMRMWTFRHRRSP